ncbi:hypothetical protein [Streptomyces sp. NPDC048340]|uniref:hypothetical protein n=1 Tax=Streptomyces sp. NPDC048340 TaxID=3365537 RepID=UPI0037208EF7
MLLVGAWTEAALLPSEFWITNIGDRPLAQLFLLAKLTDRVALDFADVCEPVGIRDFEGRSFRGWHHHATLASVAHAATLLGARGRLPEPYPGPARSAATHAAGRTTTPPVLPPRPLIPGQTARREYIR